MPNGKSGDHPFTDWKFHGRHPFPPDIEQMLDEAESLSSNWLASLPHAQCLEWNDRFCDWEAGKNLDEGRTALRELLEKLRSGELR
jgi:hypothetical protein